MNRQAPLNAEPSPRGVHDAEITPRERRLSENPVLHEATIDAELRRTGLALVPMLNEDQVRRLRDGYADIADPPSANLVIDYLNAGATAKRALAALAASVWEEAVPSVFARHRVLYSSFVMKYPGEDSALFLHRDLAVEDERTKATYAMWLPLDDTSAELDNGPLAFVDGSDSIRHGGFGPNAIVHFDPYAEHLRERLVPISVPAGTAIVYDARLLHASEPNRSDRPRLALGCLLIEDAAPAVQVVATGRRHRVLHQVDEDYFLSTTPAKVAADGFPSGYPIIDEYDEEPPTTAVETLGPEFSGEPVRRMIRVPSDVHGTGREPFRCLETREPRHDRDLLIGADDLPPVGPTIGPVAVTAVEGAVGACATAATPPGDLRDALHRFNSDEWVVVLDPGSRLQIRPRSPDLAAPSMWVVESSPVVCGAATSTRVTELELGRSYELDPNEATTVWNGCSGPVVVVLAPGAAPLGGWHRLRAQAFAAMSRSALKR